jgi:hypothetical protein
MQMSKPSHLIIRATTTLLILGMLCSIYPSALQGHVDALSRPTEVRQDSTGGAGSSGIPESDIVEHLTSVDADANTVTTRGNHAFVGIGARLVIYSVIDPTSPSLVGQTEELGGDISDIVLVGNYAYVAHQQGLSIIDVSNAQAPATVGFLAENWDSFIDDLDVVVVDEYVYVCNYDGLQVINASDSAHPTMLGTYNQCSDVALIGDYVYQTTDAGNKVLILDVSDPAKPAEVEVGSPLRGWGGAYSIAAVDNFAYIGGYGRLMVADISDVDAPRELSHVDVLAQALSDIVVADNYAYLSGLGGVDVVDVANPTTPKYVARIPVSTGLMHVAVSGDILFIAGSGLDIYRLKPRTIPLIFIPGIMGSKLYHLKTKQELWDTGLANAGLDAGTITGYLEDVNSPDIIATHLVLAPNNPPYESLLSFLTSSAGYKEYPPDYAHTPLERCQKAEAENRTDITLFTFAYDWRKNLDSSTAALDTYIECISQLTGATKVDILAHSMGGLIARRYITRFDNNSVRSLVSIGTPWLGAPKTIHSVETGQIVPGKELPWDLHFLKKIALASPSVATLFPSKQYFTLGGMPFTESGWDINNNGYAFESYTYDDLIELLDLRYPPRGAQNQWFHDTNQDDWRESEGSVRYYHIFGIQDIDRTVGNVKSTIRCAISHNALLTLRNCVLLAHFDLDMTQGDKTVTVLSAQRMGNNIDLNAPNSTIWVVNQRDDDGEAEHTVMTSNPAVHSCILFAFQQRGNCALQDSHLNTSEKSIKGLAPASNPANYLRISGTHKLSIRDQYGNISQVIGGKLQIESPEITVYPQSDDSHLIILPASNVYTVTIYSEDKPLLVSNDFGTGSLITDATRYLDINVPLNSLLELRLSPQGSEPLRADIDANGTFETHIPVTADLSGTAANDTTPPTISLKRTGSIDQTLVTLTATDTQTGVKDVLYSLDGNAFHLYSTPFLVNAVINPTVLVFADDNAANRSGVTSHQLASTVYFPTVRMK